MEYGGQCLHLELVTANQHVKKKKPRSGMFLLTVSSWKQETSPVQSAVSVFWFWHSSHLEYQANIVNLLIIYKMLNHHQARLSSSARGRCRAAASVAAEAVPVAVIWARDEAAVRRGTQPHREDFSGFLLIISPIRQLIPSSKNGLSDLWLQWHRQAGRLNSL